MPDPAIQLAGLTCYPTDRVSVEGGKTRIRVVCVYISDAWCRNAAVVYKHCSPLADFIIIKCQPYYALREFTAILPVAVYIPPTANTSDSDRSDNRQL